MKFIKRIVFSFIKPLLTAFLLVMTVGLSVFARFRKNKDLSLVWGCTPLISNKYWSASMRAQGFKSETYVHDYYSAINKREDFDKILSERFGNVPYFIKQYLAFWESIIRYDVFFLSFDGYFLGKTRFWWLESFLFKLARKKTVLLPYGGDSYVYRNIKRPSLVQGLMMSYPASSMQQRHIAKRVGHWCDHADCVIPGIMGPDGFGRWDVLIPSFIFIDLDEWVETSRLSWADGVSETVFIAHAPNHRGFKGTEYVCKAVEDLKAEGLKVELLLIEKMQNSEVKRILAQDTDILVEALVCTGHGLNGLEGMATGIPVITNLEDDSYTESFRYWSYLDECPILSASPGNIKDRLRSLVINPSLRHQLGKASRQYVDKYQGFDSSFYLFSSVISFVYGEKDSLSMLYHPLFSEHSKKKTHVAHPLVNNRLL